MAPNALARPPVGTFYQLVGFSRDGSVLARLVDVRTGLVALHVVDAASGQERIFRSLQPGEDVAAAEEHLQDAFEVISPGVPGARSPDGGALAVVMPGRIGVGGGFQYVLRVLDGAGLRAERAVRVPGVCPLGHQSAGRLDVWWSPDGLAGALVGWIAYESPCGAPVVQAVLVTFARTGRAAPARMTEFMTGLTKQAAALLRTQPWEGVLLARQAVEASPDDPAGYVLHAQALVTVGRGGMALAALWACRALGEPAVEPLRAAVRSPWARRLVGRPAYDELRWEMTAAR